MRRVIFFFALLTVILLYGCRSESDRVHGKVEDFLEATVADGYTFDIEKYENWDSTYYVSQESVDANRAYAAGVAYFKKDISYQPYSPGDKLIYVCVSYKVSAKDGSTTPPSDCRQTFYMDKDLTGIVCVKEN